tara:strand:+ start:585 stop:839 length:255 start_codon:yes stop_codon:yes gene_type:complete
MTRKRYSKDIEEVTDENIEHENKEDEKERQLLLEEDFEYFKSQHLLDTHSEILNYCRDGAYDLCEYLSLDYMNKFISVISKPSP